MLNFSDFSGMCYIGVKVFLVAESINKLPQIYNKQVKAFCKWMDENIQGKGDL